VPKAPRILLSLGFLLGLPCVSNAATDPDSRGRVDAAHAKDTPVAVVAPAKPPAAPVYRESKLDLEQSVTTQTLGVGTDYQSENPTYDLSLVFRPRFYYYDPPDERETLSLRAVAALGGELTNSDTTTERGEIAFADLELWNAYTRKVYDRNGYVTDFGLRLPMLTIPTSKISYRSGRILGLGTFLALLQTFPLRDGDGQIPQQLRITAGAGYSYNFARAIVPTNSEFGRVRMDPDGVSQPSDQLNGAALAQHQLTFRFVGELLFTEDLKWSNDVIIRPVWTYALPETDVCGVVDTGCTTPSRLDDATRHTVITDFKSELSYDFGKFGVGVGYANLALQLGPDGKRRSPLYSPDARFYFTLSANLDKIFAPEPAKPNANARAGAAAFPGSN
jgi:hypothetical protein